MGTCIFYLKGRTKIITKEFANNCWIDFKMDFGESKNEVKQVRIIENDETETLCELNHFLRNYVLPEHR